MKLYYWSYQDKQRMRRPGRRTPDAYAWRPRLAVQSRELGTLYRRIAHSVTRTRLTAGSRGGEVGQGLGKLVDSSEARAPSHTDAAEVRPRLPKTSAVPWSLMSAVGLSSPDVQSFSLSIRRWYASTQLLLLRRC